MGGYHILSTMIRGQGEYKHEHRHKIRCGLRITPLLLIAIGMTRDGKGCWVICAAIMIAMG